MPFEKIINTPIGVIGIWNLTDSSEELISQCQLSDSEQQRFNNLIAERRKKEFLATRVLLEKLRGKNQQISYNKWGKPSLKGTSTNISISHSADFATVFISEKNIGIDVEQTTRNIDRVAKRFLHPKEQEFISTLEKQQEANILFWAAKEAIFKCTEESGVEFNEQIFIAPFELSDAGEFNGSLQLSSKKDTFKLHYTFFKNNVMVYCVAQ